MDHGASQGGSGPGAYASDSPARTFPLREMLETAFRDRRRIGLAFGICFAATLLAALLAGKQYASDASLLVRPGHEYVYVADTGSANPGAATPLMFDRAEAVNAETEILASRDLVRQVIVRVGWERLYPSLGRRYEDRPQMGLDRAVDAFRDKLDVQLIKDSTVIRVSFRHRDPALAQLALRTLVEAYLERRRAIFSDERARFLDGEVATVRKRLGDAERSLADFKQTHGIVDYDQQITLLLQQANDLQTRFNEADQQAQIASAKTKKLQEIARKTPTSLVEYSETLGDPQSPRQLLDLQLKEQDLRARYVDGNPLVKKARKDVALAEDFMRQQLRNPPKNVRTGRNPVRDAAELDLMRAIAEETAYDASRKALQARLDLLKRQTTDLERQRSQFDALSRQQKLLADSYANYAHRLEDARIDGARDRKEKTSVSVLQSASTPLRPRSFRALIVFVGFFVSVVVALIVAFLSEAFRTSFLSPEKLERSTGYPVLVTLPLVSRS